eukprot:1074127-Pelagomonas_calceolata.AAC.1
MLLIEEGTCAVVENVSLQFKRKFWHGPEGMDDIRRVEGGAYVLGAGQGVHFMCRHQCSKGCSTVFCVVSSCWQLVKLVCQNADFSCAHQTAPGHGFPWLE